MKYVRERTKQRTWLSTSLKEIMWTDGLESGERSMEELKISKVRMLQTEMPFSILVGRPVWKWNYPRKGLKGLRIDHTWGDRRTQQNVAWKECLGLHSQQEHQMTQG